MKNTYGVLLAVLISAACPIVAAQAQQKPYCCESPTKTTEGDKRGTDAFPLVVQTHTVQSDKEAAEEAAQIAEQKRVNRWNIWLAFSIAVCALLQFGGIVAQVGVYLKQTKVMRDTLTAINTQANHMQTQLAFQQESLRPRLSVGKFTSDAYAEAVRGNHVIVNFTIANSGGMPAFKVAPETWIEFLDRGPKERPFRFTSAAKYNKCALLNVATGTPQGFFIPLTRRLTEEEIAKMRNGKATVCFRIRLNYSAFAKECHFDEAFAMMPGEAELIAEYTSAT